MFIIFTPIVAAISRKDMVIIMTIFIDAFINLLLLLHDDNCAIIEENLWSKN
jgi:hypothetical protein